MQPSHDFKRVYVWEQPVRWFHWINALCVIVLGVTGYLIAHPPAFMSTGEASSGYWFGKLRFTHFATAYVFLANFLFRLYWAGVGNKYTHWRNFFPVSKRQLREVWAVLKVDVLQSSEFAREAGIDYCHFLICGGPGEFSGHRTAELLRSQAAITSRCWM